MTVPILNHFWRGPWFALGCALLAAGCAEDDYADHGDDGGDPHEWASAWAESDAAGEEDWENQEFPVPKPPFSEGMWPCDRCHATLPDNFVKRELTKEHQDIVLEHGPREKWCFNCHIQKHRAKLRMASGATIDFTESYKLCGQCHGPKYRDWRMGVHGKRTGYWNGTKQFLLCAHCHDPHSPRFKPIEPKPAPLRPEMLRAQIETTAAE